MSHQKAEKKCSFGFQAYGTRLDIQLVVGSDLPKFSLGYLLVYVQLLRREPSRFMSQGSLTPGEEPLSNLAFVLCLLHGFKNFLPTRKMLLPIL